MKYGGSFTQGLAGGIQTGLNYGMQAAQIRWQNDQKKKLEAEKVKMQEVWTNFSQSAQQIYETGEMSEETERKLYALMFTLPPELQASANNLLTAVNKNDKTSAEKEFNNFKMVMEVVEATGGRVDDVALDSLINLLSPENQEKIRAVTSAYKSVKPREVTPIEFYGQSSSETRTGIAESVAGQTPGLEGVQFKQETEAPPTELKLQADTQKKLDFAYNTGNASHFNAVAKAEGVDTTFDTYKQKYKKSEVEGGTTPKAVDVNDVLFGTNGIMKNYIGSGSQLGEEQKTEIRNNWGVIKPSLPPDTQTQVEDYLKQIGIDVNTVIPEEPPVTEPEAQPNILQKGVNAVKDWLNQKGTPKPSDYANMSEDVLFKLAEEGDQLAYEEAKKRGLI